MILESFKSKSGEFEYTLTDEGKRNCYSVDCWRVDTGENHWNRVFISYDAAKMELNRWRHM